jgi:hypothetical protein
MLSAGATVLWPRLAALFVMRLVRTTGTTTILCLLALAFVAGWVALIVYVFSGEDEASADREEGEQSRQSKPSVHYAFDASDERKLVGYSDAVVVGVVSSLSSEEPLKSTIPGDETPQRQYAVEVSRVISGAEDLSERQTITVNQLVGEDPETGELRGVEGVSAGHDSQDSILREDGEYLFALKRNERLGYYDISAQPHGNVPLTDNPERERIVEEFELAAEDPADDPLEEGPSINHEDHGEHAR